MMKPILIMAAALALVALVAGSFFFGLQGMFREVAWGSLADAPPSSFLLAACVPGAALLGWLNRRREFD